MSIARATLKQFLSGEVRHLGAEADQLVSLIENVAAACKSVAGRLASAAIDNMLGEAGSANSDGDRQLKLDLVCNGLFVRANERGGQLAGMLSEEMEAPFLAPAEFPKGDYLLVFDPLDGSSNVAVNVSVGSIFSVLRIAAGRDAAGIDFLQCGRRQVCAGYAIYGPATMLVLTVGTGVHGFTLDPALGAFVLTHPSIRIPPDAREFAINVSNSRFWETPVKRYVAECLTGRAGPRGKDFNMRWVASLVAEAHRILLRGGVFLYPRDTKEPRRSGRLRLLYEANPIAFLVEQAGGSASTGRERLMDVVPGGLHDRVPFIFGAREEVERIEAYHRETQVDSYDAPLFGARGLFRASV